MIVTEEEEQKQELIRTGNQRRENRNLSFQHRAHQVSSLCCHFCYQLESKPLRLVLSAKGVYLSIPSFILRPPTPNLPRVLLHAEMKSLGK